MLHSLHIENVAVIRRLDLDFQEGFSVLTGETGAGKSIIIDSLNLLLGNRVSRELIRTGESMATVSAVFNELSDSVCDALAEMGFSCEDHALMLHRTLDTQGRSKTRLDGQVITQSMQREIARMLVSIHGQNDSQKLLQKSTHRILLDAYAHPDAELSAYAAIYTEWKRVQKRIESISQDEAEKQRLREVLVFQIADIEALKLKNGEEELLVRERDRLLNLEELNKQTALAYRALRGGERVSAHTLITRAQSALYALDGMIEGSDKLSERLDFVVSEIEDIAETVIGYADHDSIDPTERIDRIEGRLDAIAKLKRKYGKSIAEILAFHDQAKARLEELECSDELLVKLEKEATKLRANAEKAGKVLTEARKTAARAITEQVTASLMFLDMPKVLFDISIKPCELNETGADDIEFLIATNIGEPLQPMMKIASGGELSRIMLALRSVISDRDGADTVIYDEIDTGISGKTSRKVGIKLRESASGAQVLCVTHSAQIASLADTHYKITKKEVEGRAETEVICLDDVARIEEVARILGGIQITDIQRAVAKELIQEYK